MTITGPHNRQWTAEPTGTHKDRPTYTITGATAADLIALAAALLQAEARLEVFDGESGIVNAFYDGLDLKVQP